MVGCVFKPSVNLPVFLLAMFCFCNSKNEGLFLTDRWISRSHFCLEEALHLPKWKYFESLWAILQFQTSKTRIPLINGLDCSNNAPLLSALPRFQTFQMPIPLISGLDCSNNAPLLSVLMAMNMLSSQALDSWNSRIQLWKTKRSKARVMYYSNSTVSFQILLRSGDIAQNPGPNKRASEKASTESKQKMTGSSHMVPASLKCDRYDKTIRKNQNKIICEACFGQQHPKCTELNAKYAGTA